MKFFLTLLFILSTPIHSSASFSKSKRLLLKNFPNGKTFYCQCQYQQKNVDFKQCGYKPCKMHKRAKRIEWEHIVPASAFGSQMKEWKVGHPKCLSKGKKYKGRRCAGRFSKQFAIMEADMYNLYPAIGEVNALRLNYPYGIIKGEVRNFGKCDVEIKNKIAEPREAIRGDIARVYFYMDKKYPKYKLINETNRTLLNAWNKADPISLEECKRYRIVKSLQKTDNPILRELCCEKAW